MLGAVPLLLALLLAGLSTTAAFKLPLRMVGDGRKGQQVSQCQCWTLAWLID